MNEETSPTHWFFEAFAELRTMPAHWDLSELLSPASTVPSDRINLPEAASQDGVQTAPKEAADKPALPQWKLDPSAGLNTTPARWDLTELA